MSAVVTLELRIKDEAWETFRTEFPKILPDTKAFEGCEALKGAIDEKNKTIFLYEQWRESADHKKYMAWRQERGDLDQMGKALREPPILRTMGMMDI